MLYFFEQSINPNEYGPIKIGVSHDPRIRVRQIQTTSPYTIRIMGVWPDCPHTEQQIHTMFAAYRMSGEWFQPADDLIDFILTNCVDVFHAFDTSNETA